MLKTQSKERVDDLISTQGDLLAFTWVETNAVNTLHCTIVLHSQLGIWGYCCFESAGLCETSSQVFFTSFTVILYTDNLCVPWSLVYPDLSNWHRKKIIFTYRRVTVTCYISNVQKLHEQSPGYQAATEASANGRDLQAWLKCKALGRMHHCLIFPLISCTIHLDFYL